MDDPRLVEAAMKLGDVLVGLIVVLQVSAGIAYLWQRSYREALVWVAASVSNAAYLSLVRV